MRNFINIVNRSLLESQFLSLDEIYLDDSPLDDDSEIINNFVSPMDSDKPMPVKTLTAEQASQYFKVDGTPLMVVFSDHATDDQIEMIEYKKRRFDNHRVLVSSGDLLLDGYHHAVAAIQLGKPINYVDVNDMED